MIAQAVDYVKVAFRDGHGPPAADAAESQITQHVMDIWAAPPPVAVYGPTDVMHQEWCARQVYRVAVEVAKDYNWTHIDPDSPRARNQSWTDLRHSATAAFERRGCAGIVAEAVKALRVHQKTVELIRGIVAGEAPEFQENMKGCVQEVEECMRQELVAKLQDRRLYRERRSPPTGQRSH